jgi:predicted acetyltransferase
VGHEIRALVDDEELERALEVFYTSLIAFPVPIGGDLSDYIEPGRTFGAVVDGEIVGTATSFTSTLVVPGGSRVDQAMVTDVGVLPSHTRRGLAAALMRKQIEDAATRGLAVATLRASEAVIYERFGYGIATGAAHADLAVNRARLRPGLPEGGSVRLVPAATSWALMASIYDRVYTDAGWVGAVHRPGYLWRSWEHYFTKSRGPFYVAVHGRPGAEDGFAFYQPGDSSTWFHGDNRSISVRDLVAGARPARIGLLRFLLGIDLLTHVEIGTLPVDHSIEKLVLDERAVTSKPRDETWLRLIDVPAALAARTYAGPGSVTIHLTDSMLPANTGRYEISADGAKPVSGTGSAPDLSLDVAALACVYLGGTRWWQLADAERVQEHSPGAIAAADQLFGTDRAPFGGTMF